VIGVLAAALVLVVVGVLTSNTISDRKAKLGTLATEVARAQADAARLAPYTEFAKLAASRAETVREIAVTRFDWHSALSDLSKVVPTNTSLASLTGSVAPGAAGGSGIALRADITAPAFELSGCTSNQDDVARLMSRLRVMNGVTRVSLQSSAKTAVAASSTAVTSTASSGGTSSTGCGANTPTFAIVVFFKPIAGAGPQGVAALVAQSTTAAAAPTAATTAPTATSSTTGAKP
jgi:Tfp pilus assembly protein PilN